MATFQVRIENLVGVVETSYKSGSSDTVFIDDALNESIYEIINMAPPEMMHNFSTTSSEQTSNNLSVPHMKVLSVRRETGVDGFFAECKEMPLTYKEKIINPSSPFYATKENPVFIRRDGKLDVCPVPGASPDVFVYTYASYPTGTLYNESAIGSFPNELEYIFIYGAAVRCAAHLMSNIDTEIKDAMDNAKLLFDTQLNDVSGGGGTAESILFWLNDEDPEMVQATSAGAQAELARVQSLLAEKQSLQQTIQNLSGMYKGAIQAAGIQKYGQEQAQQGQ